MQNEGVPMKDDGVPMIDDGVPMLEPCVFDFSSFEFGLVSKLSTSAVPAMPLVERAVSRQFRNQKENLYFNLSNQACPVVTDSVTKYTYDK